MLAIPGTAIVHFIFNEWRPLFFFYNGFKTGIQNEMIFLAGTDPDQTAFACNNIAMVPVNYTQRVISDANHAMSVLPVSVSQYLFGQYHPECTSFKHHWHVMNGIGLLLIAGMAIGLATAVYFKRKEMQGEPEEKVTFAMELERKAAKNDPVKLAEALKKKEYVRFDARSGYYIDFTNKMERKLWYQIFAWAIVLYTTAAVFYMVKTVMFSDMAKDFKQYYFTTQMLPIVQMVYGAWKLKFASFGSAVSTGGCFKMLRFRRSWLSILNQSNKDLVTQVETATYRARYGRPAQLHKMINLAEVDIKLRQEAGCEKLVHAPHDDLHEVSFYGKVCNLIRGQDPDEPHGVNDCRGCRHFREVLVAAEKIATDAQAENPPRKVHTFLCPNIRDDNGRRVRRSSVPSAEAPLLA